ncbi:diguanylate cyclase, partial [Kineococcus sp. R8]|uniref:GGDEF domain-containing protein n=1 Tax=Kineococcus siccus TaxID=2696567 RepID=UPI00141266B6
PCPRRSAAPPTLPPERAAPPRDRPAAPASPPPAWLADDAQVAADLASVSRTGSRLFLLLAPVHLLLQPPAQGVRLAAVSVALAVVCLAVHAAREGPLLRGRPGVALAGVLLLVCAQCLVFVAVIASAWATTAVLLAVLAAGALLRSHAHVLVVVLATAGGWAVVAARHPGAGEWREYGVHLACATVLAGVLHVVQLRTVDRLLLARRRLQDVALTDELTGLANRRGFLLHGRPRVEAARRAGRPACVVVVDVDGLKRVNDTRGHAAGDELIVATAQALRRAAGRGALCARVGGDEFAVLLEGATARDVRAGADRLERALLDAGVAASLGAADLGEDASQLDDLVAAADAAMYAARELRGADPGADPGQARVAGR